MVKGEDENEEENEELGPSSNSSVGSSTPPSSSTAAGSTWKFTENWKSEQQPIHNFPAGNQEWILLDSHSIKTKWQIA